MTSDIDPYIADDALLDDPAAHAGHDELAALLTGWRAEIDSAPHRELIDTDTALAILAANRERSRPSAWLAILIAVLILAIGAGSWELIEWVAAH